MSNIFEQASRKRTRFQSAKGQLSTEDLWNLPLTALDKMAIRANKALKETAEESFIATKTEANTDLQLELDILKHVIDYKLKMAEASKKRAETIARKDQLQQILVKKQEEGLSNLSVEEIQKQLAEIS